MARSARPAWLLAAWSLMPWSAAAAEAPNLVLILVDDLGYADVPPLGQPPYPAPAIAQLAREGRCFTDFQVCSAVCSASRAGLLTGCYHGRLGLHGALGPQSPIGIAAEEVTLAELCRQRGYATACVGKWHLGHLPQFLPTRHGFDQYYGLPYSNDMWPEHPDVKSLPPAERAKRWPPLPLFRDEQVVNPSLTHDDQRQLTKRYTEEAVRFIAAHREEPFFLYLAHSMVHVPLHASEQFQGRTGAGLFGDVVAEVDWSVGQLLQALKSAGIDERTLIVFTSDNGPWLSYGAHAGSAGPLREGKGTTFEGGCRVPALMRWPGRIPAGTTCGELAATIDLLPTWAKILGADLPPRPIDGQDVSSLLFDEPVERPPNRFFFYYYGDNELQAVRDRRWKLHFRHSYRTLSGRVGRNDGTPIPYDEATIDLALYDLDADPGERRDVAAAHPDVVRRLQASAEAIRRELGDSLTGQSGRGVRPPGR